VGAREGAAGAAMELWVDSDGAAREAGSEASQTEEAEAEADGTDTGKDGSSAGADAPSDSLSLEAVAGGVVMLTGFSARETAVGVTGADRGSASPSVGCGGAVVSPSGSA
jgi:hypothetical protein